MRRISFCSHFDQCASNLKSINKNDALHLMGLSENWERLKAKQGVASPSKEKNALKLRNHKGVKNEIKLKPPAVKKLSTRKSPLEVYLWGTDQHPGKDAVGKFVAIDCEFVGVGDNDKSVLARVSLVNYYGVILLDTFVKPEKKSHKLANLGFRSGTPSHA